MNEQSHVSLLRGSGPEQADTLSYWDHNLIIEITIQLMRSFHTPGIYSKNIKCTKLTCGTNLKNNNFLVNVNLFLVIFNQVNVDKKVNVYLGMSGNSAE